MSEYRQTKGFRTGLAGFKDDIYRVGLFYFPSKCSVAPRGPGHSGPSLFLSCSLSRKSPTTSQPLPGEEDQNQESVDCLEAFRPPLLKVQGAWSLERPGQEGVRRRRHWQLNLFIRPVMP